MSADKNGQTGPVQYYFFQKSGAGFTVIEILIAIALVGIVAMFGFLISAGLYTSSSFNAEYDLLTGILQKARSQSLNNINQLPHGVHIASDEYILFEGTSFDPSDPANIEFEADSQVANSGINEVIFSQLSGDANIVGDISLSGYNRIESIHINNEGGIN